MTAHSLGAGSCGEPKLVARSPRHRTVLHAFTVAACLTPGLSAQRTGVVYNLHPWFEAEEAHGLSALSPPSSGGGSNVRGPNCGVFASVRAQRQMKECVMSNQNEWRTDEAVSGAESSDGPAPLVMGRSSDPITEAGLAMFRSVIRSCEAGTGTGAPAQFDGLEG
jgi:hypothetical protein